MTNIGDDLRATNEADSIDPNCWFCKTGSAAQGSSHKVDLHRVLARKSSYVVVGVQYKQQYETTTSRVPRCARCKSVHENVGRIFSLVWIAIGIWGSIWLIRDSGKGYDESVWGALFGVATMFLVCAVPVGFARMLVNSLWKSEDYSSGHPRVRKLTSQGWEVGARPAYKWSGDD
jgi:hypothetical protein